MKDKPSVAFVGLLSPPEESRDNPAFSQAGAMFQESLLAALRDAGADIDGVFSQRPVPSFPRSRRFLFSRLRGVAGGFAVTYIPFVNFGLAKTISAGLALLPELLRWARRNRGPRGRVIVLYNLTSPPAMFSVIVGRLTRTQVVAVVADIQVPGSGSVRSSFARRMEYKLQTATMARCAGLVVLTARMATDFAPRVPFILMEGAVPKALASSELAASTSTGLVPGSDGSETILMFAGELSELKGIGSLLLAFRRVEARSLRLWITGRGPDQALVEAAAKLDARIKYLGYPTYSELLELYKKATILVNPHSVSLLSSKYLFPSKLIEYLATGTPVITTCSTPEITAYAPYVCIAGGDSPEALANAIEDAVRVPREQLAARGAAGRDYVLRNKTWAVQGRRIYAFMTDIVAARSSRG